MRKKEKGFTFVELLAVIMILVFISLVATPIIKNIITSVRKSAWQETVNRILVSGTHYIEDYLITYHNSLEYPVLFTCDGKKCSNEDGEVLDFSGDVPVSGTITIAGANNIYATHITNNKWCSSGYRGTLDTADTCIKLDHTAPIINKENKVYVSSTSNKVIVIFPIDLMIDDETDITKYSVNLKNNDKLLKSYTRASFKNMTYVVFDKLDSNSLYTIDIIGTNGNNITTTITKNIKTNILNNPYINYNNTPILIQNGYFKKQVINIKFNSDNHYIKSTKDAIISKPVLEECVDLNTCVSSNTTIITKNKWYNVEDNTKLIYETDISDGILFLNNTALNLAKLDNDIPEIKLNKNIVKSNIAIISYNSSDNKSGVGSYICKYGLNKKMNSNSDIVSSTSCILHNLKQDKTYYYEICIKDRIDNENCIADSFKTLNNINEFDISYENITSQVTNDYYNKQIININSNIKESYYVNSSRKAVIKTNTSEECGTNKLPSECNSTHSSIINPNTWYKVSGNINILYAEDSDTIGNLIIYNKDSYNVVIPKIENTLPKAPIISGGNSEWSNTSQKVFIVEPGTAYSGVSGYEYLILTSSIKPLDSFAATGIGNEVTITESGTKYVYFRTVSNGNIKSPWSDVKIANVDFEAPDKTEIKFIKGYSSNVIQKNVEIQLHSKDNIGIKKYEADFNGDGIPDKEIDGNIFVPDKGFESSHLRFRAIDLSSNIGVWSDEIILKIEN